MEMNRIEELLATTKLNDMMHKKDDDQKTTVLWILAIIGAVAAVAAIAYAVYCFFTPDYLEDFEEDFEDDFDDDFEEEKFDEVREAPLRTVKFDDFNTITDMSLYEDENFESFVMDEEEEDDMVDDLDDLLSERPKERRSHSEKDDTFQVDYIDLD